MYLLLTPYFVLVAIYITLFRIYQPLPPPGTTASAIFKCLPIIYLFILVVMTPNIDSDKGYSRAIAVGYIFSLVGDWYMNWNVTHFLHGLGSFAIAQLCFTYGFGSSPFGVFNFSMFFIAGVVCCVILLPAIQKRVLKGAVVLYMVLLGLSGWRASVRYNERPATDTLVTLWATLFFIVSDFCIAINRWRAKFPFAMLVIMSTYYVAQVLFAISVLLPVFEAAKRFRFMGM